MIVEFFGGVLDSHQEHAPAEANWHLVRKLAVFNKRTSRVVGCYLNDGYSPEGFVVFRDTQDRKHWTIAPGEQARVVWLDMDMQNFGPQ